MHAALVRSNPTCYTGNGLAPDVQDDGFHEIQLNGKQLVFLFMAATVVSVVIFLCGVLVGRGVRAERAAAVDQAAGNQAETTPQTAPVPAPPPADADPTKAAAPAPAGEDLSYFSRLEKQNQPAEQIHAKTSSPAGNAPERRAEQPAEKRAQKPAEKSADTPVSTAASAAPSATATDGTAAASDPGGAGYAVQIAALNVKSEADAIARKLSSKGYSAYVLSPANGTPSVFRVRVGKFPTRREAESVAARLQKEEQFKPWVTR